MFSANAQGGDHQDFYSKFFIVSPIERKKEYDQKLGYSAFTEIKHRVQFVDYDYVSNLHAKSFELYELQKSGFGL